MKETLQKQQEEIRIAYKGILSEDQIEGAVKWWSEKQQDLLKAVVERLQKKMIYYKCKGDEHLNEDRVMLAYDFDSRYVALKHMTEELQDLIK